MRYGYQGSLPHLVMFGMLCSAWGTASPALANELKFTPSLAVSEEFNDNILETATGRRSDFVTQVAPGAALLYRAPSLNGDLNYAFQYRNYARGNRQDEQNHTLTLRGSAAVTEKFLFLELSDTLSRVSLDVTRDVTTESHFLNQTDQNVASVSPYLLWHLGEKTLLKTGYRFTDTRYWSVAGGTAGIDKQAHRAFADLSSEITSRLNLNACYAFGRTETASLDYNQHDISGGARYEYADKSFFFGGIGNSWQAFTDSRRTSNLFWNLGVTHDFGFLLATLETKVQYTEDPLTSATKETDYSARLEKTLQHGSVGLSSVYSEFVATLTGVEQRKLAFSGFGRYEFSPRFTATVAATADRVSRISDADFPYHFNGSAGVSYGFNYDITANLTYTYVEYRKALDSSADAKQTNRVILEVRKVF